MSLFKKPKKTIQRRVFSYGDEHGEEEDMHVDSSDKHKERDRKSDKKTKDNGKSHKKNSLLSFDDEGKQFVALLRCLGAFFNRPSFPMFYRGRRNISSQEIIAQQESYENDGQRAQEEKI